MGTFIFLFAITLNAFSPEYPVFYIGKGEKIEPFEKLWKAICEVESQSDPLAYHFESNGCASIGISQIQQSRITDFNERTGLNYLLEDMYSPEKSKTVFLHYADEIGVYNFEKIARCWNARPNGMKYKQTKIYWNKVRNQLISNQQ